jgi:hypothetical protein
MPVSLPRHLPGTVEVLWRLRPKSILEIGPGFGLYGVLARQYLEVWCAPVPYGERFVTLDCVEIHEPYITDLHRSVYDNIAIGSGLDVVRAAPSGCYDLVLILDVLEHFSREEGAELIAECRRVSRNTLVNVPYPPGPQGTVFGNEHEAHVSAWDVPDFDPCEVLEKSDALICLI